VINKISTHLNITQKACVIYRLNIVFAYNSFRLIVTCMLAQRKSRGTPVLTLRLGYRRTYTVNSTHDHFNPERKHRFPLCLLLDCIRGMWRW